MAAQPVPFEIVMDEHGMRCASNGGVRLVLAERDGRVFKRRGVKGLATQAAGDRVLPQLNALAGDLVQRPDMPAAELVARLQAVAGLAHVAEPQNVEWAVAELDGVRVYVDGQNVIVTRQDLRP